MAAADTLCYCCPAFFIILLYPCGICNELRFELLKNMKYAVANSLKTCYYACVCNSFNIFAQNSILCAVEGNFDKKIINQKNRA